MNEAITSPEIRDQDNQNISRAIEILGDLTKLKYSISPQTGTASYENGYIFDNETSFTICSNKREVIVSKSVAMNHSGFESLREMFCQDNILTGSWINQLILEDRDNVN